MSTGNSNYAVTVDTAGGLPGRGAWLHPLPQCLHSAVRRRAFAHALRIAGALDVSGVVKHIECLAAPADRTEQVAKNMSTP
jgi:predicted RNA-binding protein YlxR (DUF448 family)